MTIQSKEAVEEMRQPFFIMKERERARASSYHRPVIYRIRQVEAIRSRYDTLPTVPKVLWLQ